MAYTFVASPDVVIKPYLLIAHTGASLPTKAETDTSTEIEAIASADFSDWQTVGAIAEGITVTGDEDVTKITSSGRKLTLSEKLTLSAEDMNIANYQALRDGVHNIACDVLLVDPNYVSDDKPIPYAKNIILSILPDIGAEGKIKISAEGSQSDLDDLFEMTTLT